MRLWITMGITTPAGIEKPLTISISSQPRIDGSRLHVGAGNLQPYLRQLGLMMNHQGTVQ
jgi:hypothetical protein